jgi:hypothetical protein
MDVASLVCKFGKGNVTGEVKGAKEVSQESTLKRGLPGQSSETSKQMATGRALEAHAIPRIHDGATGADALAAAAGAAGSHGEGAGSGARDKKLAPSAGGVGVLGHVGEKALGEAAKKRVAPVPVASPAPQVYIIPMGCGMGCGGQKPVGHYGDLDHQYSSGYGSGSHDRGKHSHHGGHSGAVHSSRHAAKNTYDDYYRTTTFPKVHVRPYNSLMNLFSK